MKLWKSILVCLLVAVLSLSLCACGGDSKKEEDGNGAASDTEKEAGSDDATEPSVEEYDYEVKLAGAELFKDSDGEDAIRVYFDFTNNSDKTTSALMALSINFKQAGADLTATYAPFDSEIIAESEYYGMGIRPGVTVRCAEEYKVDPDGGVVTMTVGRGWLDENPLTFELDPASLTAPADEFQIAAIADPSWTDALNDKGMIDNKYELYIDNAEVTKGWDDQDVLRVYFDFTNNSDEAQSFSMACTAIAYQDGVQLAADYGTDSVEEDSNYSVEIEPGETIRVTRCYALRSSNEVEVDVLDGMGTTVLGASYTIA